MVGPSDRADAHVWPSPNKQAVWLPTSPTAFAKLEARGLPESEVFVRALERGLEDLWEGTILSQYLDGTIDRGEAVYRVGRPKVERTECERAAVEDDVEWGLNAT